MKKKAVTMDRGCENKIIWCIERISDILASYNDVFVSAPVPVSVAQ